MSTLPYGFYIAQFPDGEEIPSYHIGDGGTVFKLGQDYDNDRKVLALTRDDKDTFLLYFDSNEAIDVVIGRLHKLKSIDLS